MKTFTPNLAIKSDVSIWNIRFGPFSVSMEYDAMLERWSSLHQRWSRLKHGLRDQMAKIQMLTLPLTSMLTSASYLTAMCLNVTYLEGLP